ncbi:MAG: PBS lyase [Anaerolineaceae bacterium]|nr:HEAT repeat domain-containing protein [Anaerolineae bacterium]MDL1925203.1 HEAT repeat domain-containing protein [Anaerolineae bacterium AMX1]GIK09002.1 MAG: PBS lyase [Chloroflexota bacterium]GJQ39784.1 MAG: PBS lyase [Anaerolineaceae bacterium]HMM99630.1 HEAT repeat domain-containing protein [Anaerolineales bacterium]
MTKTHFQSVIDALLDSGKPFPKKYLPFFSDIDSASLQLLLDAWPRVSLTRKRTLLEDLDQLLVEDSLVSFDDLARALLTDLDAPVRAGATRLLAECGDQKLLPLYEKIIAGDPSPEVRAEAAHSLGFFVALGELEQISEAALRRAEESLLAAARDDNVEVRRRALESLGFSAREEVPALIEAALRRESRDWRVSALIAMGRSSDERWAEPVIRMLLSEDRDVRLEAARAAGELSLPAARLPLLRMLEEETDPEIFSAIVWSLSQVGGEDVRVYLENLLDQTDDDDEIDFIEDALANLAFTEDLGLFDLLAVDPEEDRLLLEEDEEEAKPAPKKSKKTGKKK